MAIVCKYIIAMFISRMYWSINLKVDFNLWHKLQPNELLQPCEAVGPAMLIQSINPVILTLKSLLFVLNLRLSNKNVVFGKVDQ